MIETRIEELLSDKELSLYWLEKDSGVSYNTLLRLKQRKAKGINFETLEKICRSLDCEPGDFLILSEQS